MIKVVYQVIKEEPSNHIGSYSDTEILSEFDNPYDALLEVRKLLDNQKWGEHFYVEVVEG